MTTRETTEQDGTSWKRRAVLRAIGVGTALPFVGVASAHRQGSKHEKYYEKGKNHGGKHGKDKKHGKSAGRGTPSCPDCPEGTTLLGKYEYDEGKDAFAFEKGACDVVRDFEITDKEGEDREPIVVEFVSDVFPHSVVVKAGQNCERFEAGDAEFAVDTEKDSDGFEGRLDLSGQKHAISHFSFCAAVCYQIDLVEGDPIRELGEDGLYRERAIVTYWGGTVEFVRKRVDRTPYETDSGGTVTDVGIVIEDERATVTFAVEGGDVELSSTSYLAPCPPEFAPDTVDQQVLFDYAPTDSFEERQMFETGTHTLSVALPGLDNLSDIYDDE